MAAHDARRAQRAIVLSSRAAATIACRCWPRGSAGSHHPLPTPAGRGRWIPFVTGPSPTRSVFVAPSPCPPGTDGSRIDRQEYWRRRFQRGPRRGSARGVPAGGASPIERPFPQPSCHRQRPPRRRASSSKPTAVCPTPPFTPGRWRPAASAALRLPPEPRSSGRERRLLLY